MADIVKELNVAKLDARAANFQRTADLHEKAAAEIVKLREALKES